MSCCKASFNKDKQVIVLECGGGRWARGLTKTLSAQFTPEFSSTVALKSIDIVKKKKHGRKHGNYVDRLVTKWANTGKKPKRCQDETFNRIVEELDQRGWLPIAGQLALGCHKLRLGTRADIICLHEGKIIIVELKCGMDDYFDVHNQGCMEKPLQQIPVSFRYKAFLQLLVTTWLYHHNDHPYRKYPFEGSYVMHVYEDYDYKTQLDIHALPFWMLQDGQILRDTLQEIKKSKDQSHESRKRVLKNGSIRSMNRYKKDNPVKKRKISW